MGEKAKEGLSKVHMPADAVEVAHNIQSQIVASKHTYKEDYKKDVEGKGRSDPANAFPEHAHLRRVAADISSTDYGKTAKKIMNECKGIPEDAAIFKIAKENAANLSDINYKKGL